VAVVTLRLFASARLAAGIGRDQAEGDTVEDVLGAARQRYGPGFAEVLAGCKVWRNGEPAEPAEPVADGDEIAVLPPVSGG
jgi:molybdopterin converting factor small subunit